MDTVESLVRELVTAGMEAGIAASIITRAAEAGRRRKNKLFPSQSKRISNDWQPTEMDYSFSLKLGMTPQEIGYQAPKFKEYYLSCSDSRGKSDDWSSKWKFWSRNFMERKNEQQNRNLQKRVTSSDNFTTGMAQALARRAESRLFQSNNSREQSLDFGTTGLCGIGNTKLIET